MAARCKTRYHSCVTPVTCFQVFECINLSLVVGLAVDYVVHLAEGYHASSAEDRLTRTRDMLEQVGVSILSGALTTLGAAMFMFGAVIVFFVQVRRRAACGSAL